MSREYQCLELKIKYYILVFTDKVCDTKGYTEASVVYNQAEDYDIITGSLVTNKDTKATLPKSNQLMVGSRLKTYLMLNGEPSESITNQVVGNITITLAE